MGRGTPKQCFLYTKIHNLDTLFFLGRYSNSQILMITIYCNRFIKKNRIISTHIDTARILFRILKFLKIENECLKWYTIVIEARYCNFKHSKMLIFGKDRTTKSTTMYEKNISFVKGIFCQNKHMLLLLLYWLGKYEWIYNFKYSLIPVFGSTPQF